MDRKLATHWNAHILGRIPGLRYLNSMESDEKGFKAALEYPLLSAIMNR